MVFFSRAHSPFIVSEKNGQADRHLVLVEVGDRIVQNPSVRVFYPEPRATANQGSHTDAEPDRVSRVRETPHFLLPPPQRH
jgi:hypothetical protein